MPVTNTQAARIARMAFMKRHIAVEKAFLEETAINRARAAFVADSLGVERFSPLVQKDIKLGQNLEKAIAVREKYLAKEARKLKPWEHQAVSKQANAMLPSDWSQKLAVSQFRFQDQSVESLQKAIKEVVVKDFEAGRASPPDLTVEGDRASKAMMGYGALTTLSAAWENWDTLMKNLFAKKSERRPFKEIVWTSKQEGPDYVRSKRVLDKVAQHAPPSPAPLDIAVFQRSDPNAFAVGAGKLGVNEGLLKTYPKDDELAYILGHEIAHNAHRDNAGKMAAQARLTKWQNRADEIPKDVLQEIEKTYKKELTAIRRRMEVEADADGLRYMARAGFDPEAGPRGIMALADPSAKPEQYEAVGYPSPEARALMMQRIIAEENLGKPQP